MDWYIFCTDLHKHDLPPNVHMIHMRKDELYNLIALQLYTSEGDTFKSLRGHPGSAKAEDTITFDTLKRSLQVLIEEQPYMLVELKPMLGAIFQDYISSYSHWGYADVDTALGKMNNLLTPEILRKFDIYTISFGDTFRYYMRGQLTIHRNDDYINNIWKSCSSLNQLRSRLISYMKSRRKMEMKMEDLKETVTKGGKFQRMKNKIKAQWHFVSAEGCYSKAVAMHPNVSVMVAPGQLSEAFNGADNRKEWLQVGDTLMRCYLHPYNLNNSIGSTFGTGTNEMSQSVDFSRSVELSVTDKNCAYWVAKEFQVCLSYVPAGVEMYRYGSVRVLYSECCDCKSTVINCITVCNLNISVVYSQ